MRFCGRDFTRQEIEWIKRTLKNDPDMNRHCLSIKFCEEFNWRKPDGKLKDMSCRVAHIKMHRKRIITLPPPKKAAGRPSQKIQRTLLAQPKKPVYKKAGEYELEFKIVAKYESFIWNEYIDRYHYLGYKPLPGAQLRYFVKSSGEILALLGFGASAWKTAPRDSFIGWSAEQRKRNLNLIVNNARFLVLPWIKSKNLCSRILSIVCKRIVKDWRERYNYQPVLMETFVEKPRKGTCYKASNWIYVGETKGRGKLDKSHRCNKTIKSIWLYPLMKNFRSSLCS